ncbi:hypothetical protein [Arthrobacter sp. UYCo732]|uniref:hypothetical protein n=1 Tax=Arthrobacter sp. UYCo732 TaxID=3156336 RepID=UPI0033958E4D
MDTTTPETLSAQRLANAERELELFERQPPLGSRAYLRGRNARRQIILELRQELTHDHE